MVFSSIFSRKLQLTLAFAGFLFAGLLFSGGKVYADCGINTGNIHDYAGLAVGVKTVDSNGNPKAVNGYGNVRIAVDTYGKSYSNRDGTVNPSGNGGYNLTKKSDTSVRDDHKWFTPRSNPGGTGCPGTDYAIVLGYDNPTPDVGNGQFWLLDCDFSLRAEPGGPQYDVNNPYQKFAIYPTGNPNGTKSGGYWTVDANSFVAGNPGGNLPNSEIQRSDVNTGHISGTNSQKIAPGNGATGRFILVYHEPPPTCQDTGTCGGGGSSTGSCGYLQLPGAGSGKRTEVRVTQVSVYSESWVNSSGTHSANYNPARAGFDEFVNVSGEGSTTNKTWLYYLAYPNPANPTGGYNTISVAYDVEHWNSNTGAWTGWGEANGGTDSEPVQYLQRNADGSTSWTTTNTTLPCFQATCTINSVDGDGPNGMLIAGGAVHVNATITNRSYDNLLLKPPKLALKGTGGTYAVSDSLNPGESTTFDFDINGGASWPTPPATTFTPSFYVSYYPSNANSSVSPSDRISADCSGPSLAVYQNFYLEPHAAAAPSGTAENPGSINYNTYINNNASWTAPAPTQSEFSATPYGGGTSNKAGPNPSPPGSFAPGNTYTLGPAAYTPPSVNAGDRYCSQVDFTGGYNSGYIGSDGSLVPTGLVGNLQDTGYQPGIKTGAKDCMTVVNKPYFKAYNSGVSAGGAFSNTGNCSGGGLLAGWNDNTGGQDRGAGSQLSALALIKITGFASAQASVPNTPLGAALTFPNAGTGVTVTTDRESPVLGGGYDSGGSYCLPNPSPKTGATIYPGGYVYGGNGSVSNSQSVFVNGDVYINGNVQYNLNNWTLNTDGSSNVPSFVLHATGNIYIAPGVSQLDGLYISEKKIYTCGSNNGGGNFAPISGSSLYSQCNQQLTVNGAFVATQVNLMRAYGSLRNATAAEKPTGGSHLCSFSGGSANKPVCAGEIFQFSPELYLSTPDVQLPSNGATQYDAITSLPPVL